MKLNELLYAGMPAHKRPKMPGFVSVLRQAMAASGKGFRRHSMRNTGTGDDRRKDKLEAKNNGAAQNERRYQQRYASPAPRKHYPWSAKRA